MLSATRFGGAGSSIERSRYPSVAAERLIPKKTTGIQRCVWIESATRSGVLIWSYPALEVAINPSFRAGDLGYGPRAYRKRARASLHAPRFNQGALRVSRTGALRRGSRVGDHPVQEAGSEGPGALFGTRDNMEAKPVSGTVTVYIETNRSTGSVVNLGSLGEFGYKRVPVAGIE